jgi:hypothetical protein
MPPTLTISGLLSAAWRAEYDGLDAVIAHGHAEGLAEIVTTDVFTPTKQAVFGGAVDDRSLRMDQRDGGLVGSFGPFADELEECQRAGKIERFALGDAVIVDQVDVMAQLVLD